MLQIDQSIIDQVISKADILDVIGKSLEFKRKGVNYFARCPFHQEKSASFSVNPNKQFFYCFGCSESGDVITFVMKYNGLDFIDAVVSLANQYGVYIPEIKSNLTKEQIKQKKEHRLNLVETINKVVNFYIKNLHSSSVASHYLANRGLNNEIINKFRLGYAPNNSNLLQSIFPEYANNKFLFDAGLLIKNDKNQVYDRFRDRVIFPIRNVRGETIGFGGRIIAKGEPKYLNSPETELFNKSQELYGLYEAQKSIYDKNCVIVVEGYLDVISLAQFGVDNVVATMGTAIGQYHIQKLLRLCDDVYFAFDGDNAGRKAAWRALEHAMGEVSDSKQAHFLFFPPEHDPDSYIRMHGYDKFIQQLKSHSLPLSSFLLNQLQLEVNIATDEGRAKLISLAKPFITKIKAPALQVILKTQLANIVNLAPAVVESILNNRSKYAFFNSKWNDKALYQNATHKVTVNNHMALAIKTALHNLDWVHEYNLPEEIAHFSPMVQELILLLDFLNYNYAKDDQVNLKQITHEIAFVNLSLEQIYNNNNIILLKKEEFINTLNYLLGRATKKNIKIPKIPIKRNN